MLKKRFGDLLGRLISSAILIGAFVLLLVFSSHIVTMFLWWVVLSFLYVFGLKEFCGFSNSCKGIYFLIPASAGVLFIGCLGLNVLGYISMGWIYLICLGFVFDLFICHFFNFENAMKDITVSIGGFVYIAIPLSLLWFILYSTPSSESVWWLVYVVLVTKMTDIGAYFTGKLFGRTRLAAKLSPKKTLEGLAGGKILAIISGLIVYYFAINSGISFIEILIVSAVLGLMGQLGDLAESLLKREAGIKDSSSLTGHGGVLDTLDSLLFSIPLFTLYLFAKEVI